MNRQTHLCLNVLAMSLVAVWLPTYASAHHTGDWKWTSTTKSGKTIETTVKLRRDKRKFIGVYIGQNGQKIPITSPKLDGRQMSFQVTFKRDGKQVTISYQGKIAGNTIKGTQEVRVGDKTSTLP